MEILNENGDPCTEGEGEDRGYYASEGGVSLIRYNIGDILSIHGKSVSAGQSTQAKDLRQD